MSWSIGTITFFVGLALMVIAIFGGGLEIKEVKIPSMGRIARAISFAIGCGLLALSLMAPQYLQRLSSDPSPPATVTTTSSISVPDRSFYLFNVLGTDQESERVEVIVDGNTIGVLDIDKVKTTAGITYRTKKETANYSIKGAQIYKIGDDVKSYQLTGDGVLQVTEGARFRLWQNQTSGNHKILVFKEDKN